jgi:phage terminase small subunit
MTELNDQQPPQEAKPKKKYKRPSRAKNAVQAAAALKKTKTHQVVTDKAAIEIVNNPIFQDLTVKQQKFVMAYHTGISASAAYIEAGYKHATPAVVASNAHRLLQNENVIAAIQETQRVIARKVVITQERIATKMAQIMDANIHDFFNFHPETGMMTLKEGFDGTLVSEITQRVTNAGVSTSIKLLSKEKMIELLGRHLGMWGGDGGKSSGPDTVIINNTNEVNINEQHTSVIQQIVKSRPDLVAQFYGRGVSDSSSEGEPNGV